ncbi:hypothetical protein N7470_004608 [Penicillium chermesinum]|nr:hypothetical protein N7470_004608 [Penicillium chermesinum]
MDASTPKAILTSENFAHAQEISRATSPGGEPSTINGDGEPKARVRPRTYPYFKYLPYQLEDEGEREKALREILNQLYISVEAGDFSPGAVHWTRELRGWLSLKFDPKRKDRVNLVKLYYELSLAPGIDPSVSERFASMFMLLTKLVCSAIFAPNGEVLIRLHPRRKHYLKPVKDLILDWRPLYKELKAFVLPAESGLVHSTNLKRNVKTLTKLCAFAQLFIDPCELPAMLEEFLPHYTTSFSEGAFVVAGLINLMLPTSPPPADREDLLPQNHLPTQFHLWSLVGRSKTFDTTYLDYLSRLARDSLPADHIPFSEHGVFTKEQSSLIFTAVLRLLEIPVGQSTSPYSALVDISSGLGIMLDRDTRKHPVAHHIARWIVMSLSPACLESEDSILTQLEGLIQAVETFFHPSNSGSWTKTLSQLVYYLTDFFVMRWNREQSGEMDVPAERRLNEALKRRFVICLRDVIFMGIYAKSSTAMTFSLSTLQGLAYLEPHLILPGALQRIYPSLQGLVEEDVNCNMLAMQWISGEMERMEEQGADVQLNYETELDDETEELILRSSTCGFGDFIISFLGRVFTLLENLPDVTRVRNGSPEENIVNTLPATFMPLLASLSPEYYDIALSKIVDFVSNHVIHQARDAMAFICNALCKVNPEKALKRFIPVLTQAIRTEIEENGAGSTRTTGTDVLPRDRGLVWNVSMLSMCVVHVGDAVLAHRQELFDIAVYMQKKCQGIPTVHISNFIHHLLLNLTGTYTRDFSLYEPSDIKDGIQPKHWSYIPSVEKLSIQWHVPQRKELEFAVEVFENQAESALRHLVGLTNETSSIKRDGSGKEWSDEVTRNLVLLRLLLSGISVLFDPKAASKTSPELADVVDAASAKFSDGFNDADFNGLSETEADSLLDSSDEVSAKESFTYPTGYPLTEGDALYNTIHGLRERAGWVLHEVHRFLSDKQEDDVPCFGALYSAFRSWFVDVGIERSAHVLDRVTRLLAADIHPYKMSGIRKDYPRALLVRRANVYHLQRLRHNAAPRTRSKLDEILLFDLAESCVSLYTETRRNAQNAGESALKSVWGARSLIIPPLLKALQKGVRENDHARIKGALYSLLLSSVAKTAGRNWKYTPTLIRTFIEASAVDKPSVQKICSTAVFQIMDYGRAMERMAILDQSIVEAIAPANDVTSEIEQKRKGINNKRASIEKKKADLAEELVNLARVSHWKIASRAATIVITMGLRFDYIASENLIELVTLGSIDDHPGLRGMYSQALIALFTMIDVRAICSHEYKNYILGHQRFPAKIKVATRPYEEGWTQEYLSSFAKPEAEYYVDHDYPGWLLWSKTMPAYKSNVERDIEYDEVEWNVRTQMGKLFTREWFSKFFRYLKQEPRDPSADKFRMSCAMMLLYAFELLLRDGLTAASFKDIQEEIQLVFEDGSDKHQHRATAEILGALISSVADTTVERRATVWDFRLDMSTNAAFKESSKINLLHQCIIDAGWHFQLDKPIVQDFLAHLDHPYKGVREAMGQTLATIYRTRYHESYPDLQHLLDDQRKASSVGSYPYRPSDEFSAMVRGVFDKIEAWRHDRVPGQQTPSSYTSGSKTVLLWLDSTLSSHECTQLVPFFPDVFTAQLLHMMDVKEDPELQSLAYHVFRHLPNIPYPAEKNSQFIQSLIRIGQTSTSWHQRLRVMINIQIIYFRRLFLLDSSDRDRLFECIAAMLEDPQHEVRAGASATLSGMIRCSPVYLRNKMVHRFQERFTRVLAENPLPKKPRAIRSGLSSAVSSGAGTPTPEHNRLIIVRHGAVLGLGALIQAFPYNSPPPRWMPEALTTLSIRAASDPGVVGSSVKSIISDFKKTRQDTWHIDAKAFTSDQLEDLSGVLWKSYFA